MTENTISIQKFDLGETYAETTHIIGEAVKDAAVSDGVMSLTGTILRCLGNDGS